VSDTPLCKALNCFTFALKDSAEAFVDRFSIYLTMWSKYSQRYWQVSQLATSSQPCSCSLGYGNSAVVVGAMAPTPSFNTFISNRKVYKLSHAVKTLDFVFARVVSNRNGVLFDYVNVNEFKVVVFFALLYLLNIKVVKQSLRQK
jgi:hypothetical protein